jgi:hypothetical protein
MRLVHLTRGKRFLVFFLAAATWLQGECNRRASSLGV